MTWPFRSESEHSYVCAMDIQGQSEQMSLLWNKLLKCIMHIRGRWKTKGIFLKYILLWMVSEHNHNIFGVTDGDFRKIWGTNTCRQSITHSDLRQLFSPVDTFDRQICSMSTRLCSYRRPLFRFLVNPNISSGSGSNFGTHFEAENFSSMDRDYACWQYLNITGVTQT